MRVTGVKRVLAATLVLMLGLGVASTWAEEVAGKVKSVDVSQRIVVLEDGTMIWIAEGIVIESVQEGKSVKASYEERDGKKVATSVEVAD